MGNELAMVQCMYNTHGWLCPVDVCKNYGGSAVVIGMQDQFLQIPHHKVFLDFGPHLRENMSRGVYVDGLTEQSIASARDAYQVTSN